jgi:hypothetical protein
MEEIALSGCRSARPKAWSKARPQFPLPALNSEWTPLIEELQRALGTKVRIVGKQKRGKIEIDFFSPDELDRIIELLRR